MEAGSGYKERLGSHENDQFCCAINLAIRINELRNYLVVGNRRLVASTNVLEDYKNR